MKTYEETKCIYDVEKAFEWRKWVKEIPYIKFDAKWEVKVIPPFGGAVVRFHVKRGNESVSVYLDCYSQLGWWDSPYWEVYPHDHDVFRCDMDEVGKLLVAIRESFAQQRKEKTEG
jgi:hypothetical protein